MYCIKFRYNILGTRSTTYGAPKTHQVVRTQQNKATIVRGGYYRATSKQRAYLFTWERNIEGRKIIGPHEATQYTGPFETTTISQPVSIDFASMELATKKFPLLELPRELRDAIYKVALEFDFTVDASIAKGTRYGFPNLRILRLNRQVYEEARYVFLRGSLFIRVATTMPLAEVNQLDVFGVNLRTIRKCVEGEKCKHFMGSVMDYSIINTDLSLVSVGANGAPERTVRFIIPLQVLQFLCSHIARVAFQTPDYHKKYQHVVSLKDPYIHLTNHVTRSFYNVKVQEKILSVFRLNFKELFPYFYVSGDVSAPLEDAAISDIAVVKHRDPWRTLADLEGIVQHSKQRYREKDYEGASVFCTSLEQNIKRIHRTFIGDRLAEMGGQDFRYRLLAMRLGNHLRDLKYAIKLAESGIQDSRTSLSSKTRYMPQTTAHNMWRYYGETRAHTSGSNWWPTIQQAIKMYLRSAIAYRLTGKMMLDATDREQLEKICMERAEKYIAVAMGRWPNDLAVEAEYLLISAWKQRIHERERNQQPMTEIQSS
ncbi:hypothetical protein HYALB_00009442 [Hymenoscyphus albidus]|uniref:Uncharacterized protein n=1 Tax=Hymenoscyphus albidus TaxID=595503 RepID=A0A9N9LPL2_9HELO|nr:hypothetical protein HYALB_00009442 [Hymenoscyphus albidus]